MGDAASVGFDGVAQVNIFGGVGPEDVFAFVGHGPTVARARTYGHPFLALTR